jgi:hypothetical protein
MQTTIQQKHWAYVNPFPSVSNPEWAWRVDYSNHIDAYLFRIKLVQTYGTCPSAEQTISFIYEFRSKILLNREEFMQKIILQKSSGNKPIEEIIRDAEKAWEFAHKKAS